MLTPEVLDLIIVIVLVVVGFTASRYFNTIRYTENMRRLVTAWSLVDEAIYDLIIFIADDQADMEDENLLAAAEAANIDVRMYWLIQEVESLASGFLGYTPDFVQLHRRAERIHDELQADPEVLTVQ